MHTRKTCWACAALLAITLVPACRKVVRLKPDPIALVTGRVVNPAGTPIETATITALPGDGRPIVGPTRAEHDGAFALRLRTGFYTFHIAASDFEDLWRTVVVTSDAPTDAGTFVITAPKRGPRY